MKGLQFLQRRTSRVPCLLATLFLLTVPRLLRADTFSATITQPTGAVTLYAGQTQLFAGTTDTGGTITWAFGDGGTASGAAVSHTYSTAGSYTAVMTVTATQQVCALWRPDGSCSRYKNVTFTYTASRSITVQGKPTLSDFSASPSSVGSGGPVTLSWSVSGATVLTLSPGGAVSGTSMVVHPTGTTTYTLTASNPAGATTALATVTVVPLTIQIAPASVTTQAGASVTFSATVSGGGSPSQAVTWRVVTANGGSISDSGTYTAPAVAGDYTVEARSVQDPQSAATAIIHVPGFALRLKKDILYVGGKEVAEVDAAGTSWITFDDHLGSPRFQWDGTSVTQVDGVHLIAQKYAPFGEYLNDLTTQAKFAKGFTNHEQTDSSGLIYMQARFYAPMYGRFLSPDPARDQHFEQTQSWNIYSYVQNSPTLKLDPTGMNWFHINNEWQWHAGSRYTTGSGSNKKTYTSEFTHLLVVRALYSQNGTTKYVMYLYHQNDPKPEATSWAFSGGAGGKSQIPDGNYFIRGDWKHAPPTKINSNSPDHNPPADYGIQTVLDTPLLDSKSGLKYSVYPAYGPMRAYLNPMPDTISSPGSSGNYLHGQVGDRVNPANRDRTHGCLCYGQNPAIISIIWNESAQVGVSVDTRVAPPQ